MIEGIKIFQMILQEIRNNHSQLLLVMVSRKASVTLPIDLSSFIVMCAQTCSHLTSEATFCAFQCVCNNTAAVSRHQMLPPPLAHSQPLSATLQEPLRSVLTLRLCSQWHPIHLPLVVHFAPLDVVSKGLCFCILPGALSGSGKHTPALRLVELVSYPKCSLLSSLDFQQ